MQDHASTSSKSTSPIRHMITTGIQDYRYRLRIHAQPHRWSPVLGSAGPVWSRAMDRLVGRRRYIRELWIDSAKQHNSCSSCMKRKSDAIAKLQWGMMPSLLVSSALPQLPPDLHHAMGHACVYGFMDHSLVWFGTLSHSSFPLALFFSDDDAAKILASKKPGKHEPAHCSHRKSVYE